MATGIPTFWLAVMAIGFSGAGIIVMSEALIYYQHSREARAKEFCMTNGHGDVEMVSGNYICVNKDGTFLIVPESFMDMD